MGEQTLIIVVIFSLTLIAAGYCIIKADRLPVIVRFAAIVPFTLLTFFSIFGFLASGEPGVSPLWKVGYATLFLIGAAAAVRLATAKKRLNN